jgi:hypothetical protein
LCGQLLIRAKANLRHGEWQAWLTEHCTLSHVTATRYMRGARRSQNTGQSIRQWYITTGILPEPQRPEAGQLTEQLSAFDLCRMAKTFVRRLDLVMIQAWTAEDQQALMQSLRPIHDTYTRLSLSAPTPPVRNLFARPSVR